MFYILRCDELGKRYSVVDTADGVVECYTPEQLVQFHLRGIRIDGVEFTEKEISVGVTKNLDFICFSKRVSDHMKGKLSSQKTANGWVSIDTTLYSAGFSVDSVAFALKTPSSLYFLCVINGKVYLYSSEFDDFYDLSREIKYLKRVKDMQLSDVPERTYRGQCFTRFKIRYEGDFVNVELHHQYIKFEVEKDDITYKIVR